MKFGKLRIFSAFLLMVFTFSGCLKDSCTSTRVYKVYKPIYKKMSEVREMIEVSSPREMESTGRIFVRKDHLFVNEKGAGVHVVNISNPASPVHETFLTIPGNLNMATFGNYLYCDNFVDLVVFDISDFGAIKLVGSKKNVFPENVLVNEHSGFWERDIDTTQGVVIDWTEEEVEVDCSDNSVFDDGLRLYSADEAAPSVDGNSGSGQGGSMARFTILSGMLYVLDLGGDMRLFELSSPESPEFFDKLHISVDIETIFPYSRNGKKFLFMGAANGMYIYNNDNPKAPEFESNFLHIESCDPVVAEDDDTVAYVTLRSGTNCGGNTNELQVVKIKDLTQPSLISTYAMNNPHGLGIDAGLLFICDGDAGLKVYDVSKSIDDIEKRQKAHLADFFAYDVIPYKGLLILSSQDGFRLIDYTDQNNIKEVGSISKMGL